MGIRTDQLGQYISLPSIVAGIFCVAVIARPAPGEEMQYPVSVVQDAAGTIFVADQELPGIWTIRDGVLETFFVGAPQYRTPLNAIRCVALDADGKLLAGDSGMREVFRFDDAGEPVPLTGGKIGVPMGIAVRKNGEILASDLELHCIWKIPAEGGEPTKLAEIDAPIGICLDDQDRLWVVSRRATALLRVSPDGTIEKLLEDRPFNFPNQIAVDDQGVAWITDGYERAVWQVGSDGEPRKVVEGEPLASPNGIVRVADGFLIADPKTKAILRLGDDGTVSQAFPK